MKLRVEKVDERKPSVLIRYCADHGPEHDESFLPGRDFALSPDYPSYLLWNAGTPAGAAVLIRTPHYRNAGKGRFSVFHSILNDRGGYSLLLDAVRAHFHGLNSVFLFLPEAKREVRAILEGLGFKIKRFCYVLKNQDVSVEDVRFPNGFAVHPLAPSDREGIREYADCANECLGELSGHVPSSPDDVRAWFDEEWYLEQGICLLRKDGLPAGTVCVMRGQEKRESAEIGALGILPPFRGRGLGRLLLRYARSFAIQKGLHPVILSVHAENEKAVALYKSEGYTPVETMVCYELNCAGEYGNAGLEDR